MTDRIGLTDDQKKILNRRVQDFVRARERLNECVRLLGGPGAVYDPSEGVIRCPAEGREGGPPPSSPPDSTDDAQSPPPGETP